MPKNDPNARAADDYTAILNTQAILLEMGYPVLRASLVAAGRAAWLDLRDLLQDRQDHSIGRKERS